MEREVTKETERARNWNYSLEIKRHRLRIINNKKEEKVKTKEEYAKMNNRR